MKKLSYLFCIFLFFGLFLNTASIANNQLKSLNLDELFSLLKAETDEKKARKYENQIWQIWLKPKNEKINGLMNDAYYFRKELNITSALESLNEIISKEPNYAEAWNQRAIAYYYQNKFDLALVDIEKTLELEPRHFGAMAGRAVIYLRKNKHDLAKASIKQALEIHPFLQERELFPELNEKNNN